MKRLKKFDELFEFTATPHKWEWKQKDKEKWTAEFNSDLDSYKIFFKRLKSNLWLVSYMSDSVGDSGEHIRPPKEAMRTLMTAGHIIIDFLKENPDKIVEFVGAADDDGDPNKPSRRDRVYHSLLKNLPQKFHFKIESDGMTVRIADKKISLDEK